VILAALPMGITGVLLTLYLTGTSLNVMSLMGSVMMVGVVVSNSILLVHEANGIRDTGAADARLAIRDACSARFRVVVMTSLATVVGLLPLAVKLGTGGEAYVPMARAIIGGMTASVVTSVFAVPALWYLVNSRRATRAIAQDS
jgi:HAE1 family hydrophobic/amphiphilic exporter-1